MNVTYYGKLNENWTIVPTIYFFNFIILGEATMNWKCMENYWQLAKYAILFSKENSYLYLSDSLISFLANWLSVAIATLALGS